MIIISPILKNSILRKYFNLVLGTNTDFGMVNRNNFFQFRCNVCGDSKKNKNKKRGYLLLYKDRWSFKCHNCSVSMSGENWLKRFFPVHYKQYIVELLQNQETEKPIKHFENTVIKKEENIDEEKQAVASFFPILKGQTDIFDKARNFCIERKIPDNIWKTWFVSTKGKYGGRLIIPFYDKEGQIYHYQARTLCNQLPKYLNRINNDKIDSLYNKYFINRDKPIIVQEGPINSIFVENSIATCGLSFSDDFIKELKLLGTLWFMFDYDDPGLEKSIELLSKGFKVFLWKKFIVKYGLPQKEKWDMNDVILYTGKIFFNQKELESYFTNSIYDKIYL